MVFTSISTNRLRAANIPVTTTISTYRVAVTFNWELRVASSDFTTAISMEVTSHPRAPSRNRLSINSIETNFTGYMLESIAAQRAFSPLPSPLLKSSLAYVIYDSSF